MIGTLRGRPDSKHRTGWQDYACVNKLTLRKSARCMIMSSSGELVATSKDTSSVWPNWASHLADDKLFQSVAGLASIFALLITLRVWWITHRISQRISANVRLPALGRELANDLTELNRLNLTQAPIYQIAACLAKCRSRLRSIRNYKSNIRSRRWVRLQIWTARLTALVGAEYVVRQISYSVYGELLTVVLEIEDFAARIPLGVNDA